LFSRRDGFGLCMKDFPSIDKLRPDHKNQNRSKQPGKRNADGIPRPNAT
jgi:hypothetical protein